MMLATMFMLLVFIAYSSAAFSYDFPVEVPPPWLKVGTYVEYDCIVHTYGEKSFVFRWECITAKGLVATLNITAYELPGRTSAIVDIVTNTRDLLDSNGTLLGKAGLWLPPNLKVGDKVIVSGKPPNEVVAEVTQSGGGSSITCQGFQEICQFFAIQHKFMFDGLFDLDTGLIVAGPDLDFIMPHSVLGLSGTSWIEFLRATNVDLGPRYWRTEILTFLWNTLPIWLPSIIFITALVVIIRKRRKRRHLKQTKISKTKI